MNSIIKALALITLALYFTACGGDGSSAADSSSKQPISAPVADDLIMPITTTTTLPPATINSLSGTYTNAANTLDIQSDGSFTATTTQVLRTTNTGNSSTGHQSYSCSITGSVGQQLTTGTLATYALSIQSTTYYRPANAAPLNYTSFGCIGSASSTVISIEQTSATCLRVQNLGVINQSSPDNTGLTFCK